MKYNCAGYIKSKFPWIGSRTMNRQLKSTKAQAFFPFFLLSSSLFPRTIFTYHIILLFFISVSSSLLRFCCMELRLLWEGVKRIEQSLGEQRFSGGDGRWHNASNTSKGRNAGHEARFAPTAAWSNIVQWLSNELMHSPVHVPIMHDTLDNICRWTSGAIWNYTRTINPNSLSLSSPPFPPRIFSYIAIVFDTFVLLTPSSKFRRKETCTYSRQ